MFLSAGPVEDTLEPHLRPLYLDMRTAQIKTVSFLTYLLRQVAGTLRPNHQAITDAIVNLLQTTPDNVQMRKELLVANRHILNTGVRRC